MRRMLMLTIAALALAGCAQQAPVDEPGGGGPVTAPEPAPGTPEGGPRDKVVVYSPHGQEMLGPFEKRFEAAHPDIDMEWLDLGSQAILDRLRAEKANPNCDVWWGAPHTMFDQAAEQGLLAAYTPTWAEAVPPQRKDAQDRWYGQYLTLGCIMYNTEALTAEQAPQDWDDLLDAKWDEQILIRDPLDSGTMRTFIAAMILRQPTVKEGFEWLLKLDANTAAYTANPALLHRQLSTREGLVSVWNLRDIMIQQREHGYKLGYVLPESGCFVITDAIAMVQGGPHPEAAKVFYEYVTDTEQMVWSAEEFDTIPARTDIPAERLPERLPTDFPELDLDWDAIAANGDEWVQEWDRVVRNQGG